MSIKFCVVSGKWPGTTAYLPCGREQPADRDGCYKRSVEHLSPTCVELTKKVLEELQRKYVHQSIQSGSFWTKLTIVTLLGDEQVICFNLIPKNLTEPHIVHAFRIREGDDLSKVVYEHHRGPYKFYLPVKTFPEDKIYKLAPFTIAQTLSGLSVNREVVELALRSVNQDPTMIGIALTVIEGTFIWMKSWR